MHQVKAARTPGATLAHYKSVNKEWKHTILRTVRSATHEASLRKELGLQPTLHLSEQGQWTDAQQDRGNVDVLMSHWALLTATVGVLNEYSVLISTFPWRFACLTDSDEEVIATTMEAARTEWVLVLELEQRRSPLLAELPHTRWQVYRELMSVCELYSWRTSELLMQLVAAYFPSMMTSVPAELVFQHLRDAETRGQRSTLASASNLQAVVVRAAEQCFTGYERVALDDNDWMTALPPSHNTVRRNVFDPGRLTDAAVGNSGILVVGARLILKVPCGWGHTVCYIVLAVSLAVRKKKL